MPTHAPERRTPVNVPTTAHHLPATTDIGPAPDRLTVPDHLLSDPTMTAAMIRIQEIFQAGQQHLPAVHTTPVPGAVEAIEPGTGARIWVYLPTPPSALDTAPVHQGNPAALPGWAKAVALLMGTGAASLAGVIAVLGIYATSLAALAPLLWALGVILLALAVLLGLLLVRRHTTARAVHGTSEAGARHAETEMTTTSIATSRGLTIGRTTTTTTSTTRTRIS